MTDPVHSLSLPAASRRPAAHLSLTSTLAWLGVAGVAALVATPAPAGAQAIRACRNPAGQVRLVGPAESCRPQETLVIWNEAGEPGPEGPAGPAGPEGPQGPAGLQGAKGDDAPGVTGGSDFGPPIPGTFAELSSTPTPLTTENIATGFPAYMVWANVAVEFNSGNTTAGTTHTAQAANCQIVYTVNGIRPPGSLVDGRSVAFPISSFVPTAVDRIVRLNIGLTGLISMNGAVPLSPSDVVDVTLQCGAPAPPTAPSKVKALNWSLTGIGVNHAFPPP